MIEVPALRSMAMLVRIDMGADLNAAKAEITNASLQFLSGEVGILQRDSPQPDEARRMRPDHFRDVIVQEPGKIEGIRALSPNS